MIYDNRTMLLCYGGTVLMSLKIVIAMIEDMVILYRKFSHEIYEISLYTCIKCTRFQIPRPFEVLLPSFRAPLPASGADGKRTVCHIGN